MTFQWHEETDYLVVGSGASGATSAMTFAESGHSTLIIEEGSHFQTSDYKEDMFSTMHHLFREFGMQVASGSSVIPVLEGSCVGGSTVINGAILHRFPEKIFSEWEKRDSLWGREILLNELLEQSTKIEKDLRAKRNLDPILSALPAVHVLKERNWKYGAMWRNAPDCLSSGRCLQGCPTGGKWSMDKSYIPRAITAGAKLWPDHRMVKLLSEGNKVLGGKVWDKKSRNFKNVRARKSVVIASGVVQTPLLLQRSNIHHRHLGKHFQAHLSIAVAAKMKKPVINIFGPPQGIEVFEFDNEGIKLATQLVPIEFLLARTGLVGSELLGHLEEAPYIASWMASIQSDAEGSISYRRFSNKPRIRFEPSKNDLIRLRSSLYHLSHFLFECGANEVFPGVHGAQGTPVRLKSHEDCKRLWEVPLDPKYYWISLGHLFGTSRLGSDPSQHCVDAQFGFHGWNGVSVVDASLFPSNLGVNPQHSIMSLARVASERILRR